MDNKLLLVKSITLLYREGLLAVERSQNSSELIKTVLSAIKLPELNLSITHEKDVLAGLKETALDMCDNPPDDGYDGPAELLLRLKLNCANDEKLYESFVQAIEPELQEASLKRSVVNLRKTINNHFREEKVFELINKASTQFKFHREKIKNFNQFVAELCSQLEPFQLDSSTKDPAIISDVDTSNLKDITTVFTTIRNAADGASILKTGWQSVNKMLQGGFRRGEQWVIGALQHKWKTGFSLTLFKQLAIYNTPVLTDPTKKPLLLRISFEDPLTLNFQFLYETLKENETGEKVDIVGISENEMAEYVQRKLAVNGYHTRFMHVNPSLWTYKNICNTIIELESQGFEVHACMLDYLLKLPTTGCDQGPMGHDIRNMYERVYNFMKARDILMITPHQLSPGAKMLTREDRPDFVKELVDKGYYSGSSQIDQVVDGEIFIHIEKANGESFLTIQRGKHRIISQASERDKYSVLKFNPVGGIPDDLGKADSGRKKVGGGVVGSGQEIPFWETGLMV